MTTSDAVISADGLYRYRLDRRWTAGPKATFVMLNPSTADATTDDRTIGRCIGFAKAWGCGGLTVVNLFAWRATDPRELARATDPVGPYNDLHLAAVAGQARYDDAPMVAAWGAHATPARVKHVLAMPGFERLVALGLTKAGQPRHPLYLKGTSARSPWPVTS